jgi:hypothetical protein
MVVITNENTHFNNNAITLSFKQHFFRPTEAEKVGNLLRAKAAFDDFGSLLLPSGVCVISICRSNVLIS